MGVIILCVNKKEIIEFQQSPNPLGLSLSKNVPFEQVAP
jgi:hypothetical protein